MKDKQTKEDGMEVGTKSRSSHLVPTSLAELGTRIAEACDRVGSKRALAKKIGSSETQVYNWIRGENKPGSVFLVKIAEAARLSLEWLSEGKGSKELRSVAANFSIPFEAQEQTRPASEVAESRSRYSFSDLSPQGEREEEMVALALAVLRSDDTLAKNALEWNLLAFKQKIEDLKKLVKLEESSGLVPESKRPA